MLKLTVLVMDTIEAFEPFLTDELKEEYKEELKKVDVFDTYSIQHFLDTVAPDTERLTESQCDLLNLDYQNSYYISTWKNEYLSKQ